MVIDTSVLVAILLREPDADEFLERFGGGWEAVMSAASYVELAIVARSRGAAGRAVVDELIVQLAITILPVTLTQAHLAADAYGRFGKGRHPTRLNYGDCFAYALAKERGEPLLFKGGDFARMDVVPAL
jgi:ribonuclease VapC